MKSRIIKLILIATCFYLAYFALELQQTPSKKFEIGACIAFSEHLDQDLEYWEKPNRYDIYQILDHGDNKYRVYVLHPQNRLLDLWSQSIEYRTSYLYQKVACPARAPIKKRSGQ